MKPLAYYFPRLILLIFVTEQSKLYPKSHTFEGGGGESVCLSALLFTIFLLLHQLTSRCDLKYQQFLANLEIVLNIRLFSETGIVYSLSSYSDGNTIV